MAKVVANPYAFPFEGEIAASDTALVLIDMQVDFCGFGGYVDQMGYDLSLTRAPIEPLQRVLAAARRAGVMVLHTREGHRPSLADCAPNKLWRSGQIGASIGSCGPRGRVLVRGEPGWDLIDELKPLPSEDIIEGPGKGKMVATDMEHIFRCSGIKHVFIGGITTDVCCHTTMREANDRGFECCLISDGTGATDKRNHEAALKMITMQGGVFGAHATAAAVVAAMERLPTTAAAPSNKPVTWPRPENWPLRGGASSLQGGQPGPPSTLEGGGPGCVAEAKPFKFEWPALAAVGVIMIDWQSDFVAPSGFGASIGHDVGKLRVGLKPARAVLDAARAAGCFICHTLEAHRPDLSDLPPSKKRRFGAIGETNDAKNGRILIAGEPGNGIVDEVAPLEGEMLLHKPGKGSFCNTNLEAELRSRGVSHLLVTGVTTDVCVQTTVREANDRGFDCLVVSDATESYDPAFKEAALAMMIAQNGIVGWAADSKHVVNAINAAVKARGSAAVSSSSSSSGKKKVEAPVVVVAAAAASSSPSEAEAASFAGCTLLAVSGSFMRGLAKNPDLLATGARFLREATTEATYRSWSIGDESMAMVRATGGLGKDVQVEIWQVPTTTLGTLVAGLPGCLTVGRVKLDDGADVLGFLGEHAAVEDKGAVEITNSKGWRAYLASKK